MLSLYRRGIINLFFPPLPLSPPFYDSTRRSSLISHKSKNSGEAWWSIRVDSIARIPVDCSQFYQLSIPARVRRSWGRSVRNGTCGKTRGSHSATANATAKRRRTPDWNCGRDKKEENEKERNLHARGCARFNVCISTPHPRERERERERERRE